MYILTVTNTQNEKIKFFQASLNDCTELIAAIELSNNPCLYSICTDEFETIKNNQNKLRG